jgi:hypothetical protein
MTTTFNPISTTAPAGQGLPSLEAPAITPLEPSASYKLAYSDTSCWYQSRDFGVSSQPTRATAVAGAVMDLALQIAPARQRSGDDFRLRLAFREASGELVELNLNAISRDGDGVHYIPSPARSLAGALLSISESEDDMAAFCHGARFRLRPGQGRGLFLETDLAVQAQWLRVSGPMATLRISKQPERFCSQIAQIKSRFRSCGLLFAGPAIQRVEPSELELITPDF